MKVIYLIWVYILRRTPPIYKKATFIKFDKILFELCVIWNLRLHCKNSNQTMSRPTDNSISQICSLYSEIKRAEGQILPSQPMGVGAQQGNLARGAQIYSYLI
jgi:hypothetical protein